MSRLSTDGHCKPQMSLYLRSHTNWPLLVTYRGIKAAKVERESLSHKTYKSGRSSGIPVASFALTTPTVCRPPKLARGLWLAGHDRRRADFQAALPSSSLPAWTYLSYAICCPVVFVFVATLASPLVVRRLQLSLRAPSS